MRPQHQTKYVVRTAIEGALKALNQAVDDMPYPVTPEDHEVREAAYASVQRIKDALLLELEILELL